MKCKECNKEFYGARNKKYCSVECRNKFWRRKENRTKYDHVCAGCGDAFQSNHYNQKYCTISCGCKGERNPAFNGWTRRNWNKNNIEKRRAQRLVQTALNKGQITKPKQCEQCGRETRLHGHHSDYSKPLDVRWLCSRCHFYAESEEKTQCSVAI